MATNAAGEGMAETSPSVAVRIVVNGAPREAEIETRTLLVHFLRENLGLTGAHVGCDTTNCGACTVLLDGRAVKSCTVLAVQADGREVQTVEGLASGGTLHPVQEAFYKEHGLQCGFCTPGMIMASVALLAERPRPTEAEIREALTGNLCRCTGYGNIVKAVQRASRRMGAPSRPRTTKRKSPGRRGRGGPARRRAVRGVSRTRAKHKS